MAIDLDNAIIWPMRDGKARGRGVQGYNFDLTPFRSAGVMPRFSPYRSKDMPQGFGAATLPDHEASTTYPAGGWSLNIGFTTWMMAMLDAGRTVRLAISIACPYEKIYYGSLYQCPTIQSGHTTGKIVFRVRFNNTTGVFVTYIGENSGTVGSPVLSGSNVEYATTAVDIATNNENRTEWYIQFTPNDPLQSAYTHKHNIYVAMRTFDPSGGVVFPLTMHQHYDGGAGTPTGASLPRMPSSDLLFTLGKTIDSVVPGGIRGDYLGMIADAGSDGSVVTNTTTIGAELDTIWERAAKYITRRDLRGRNRSGVYAVV